MDGFHFDPVASVLFFFLQLPVSVYESVIDIISGEVRLPTRLSRNAFFLPY